MTDACVETPLDDRLLRTAFGKFPTGVVAVCAMRGTEPVGMAVSAFMPVSLDPPLLSVCIQLASTTWPRLREGGVVGVSVLSRAQQSQARRLASKEGDRFAGLDITRLPSGAVVVGGTQAWFECAIRDSHEAGDHEIVLLEILRLGMESRADDPMVFFASGFRGLRHLQAVRTDGGTTLETAPW